MFAHRAGPRQKARDEAEKPFWISYADLMTALMVLFLVVMSVALLAVTKTVTDKEREEALHNQDIEALLDRFAKVTEREEFSGITIDRLRHVVDFGTRAHFAFGKSTLTTDQERLLRRFVPAILGETNDDLGKRILKQIVVEGFTDKAGTYLSNLDLSLQRSQRVLCALYQKTQVDETPLTEEELEEIRALFRVGGYSFNATKDTDEQSRRIEMRLEFLGIREKRPSTEGLSPGNFGACALKS